MAAMFVVLGLLSFIPMVTAVYNVTFCNAHIGVINSTGFRKQEPVFFDNFYTFAEEKDPQQQTVTYSEMYYSSQSGQFYGVYKSPVVQMQTWLDTQYDEVMNAPLDSKCRKLHNISLVSTALFGWDYSVKKNVSYLGESQSRGIATQKWIICEYFPGLDMTYVTTWDIVDAVQFQLPAVQPTDAEFAPVLPISASTVFQNGSGSEVRQNLDYTHFARIQPDDRHFQIPADLLCANKPNSQKPLPVIPTYFSYKAEQLTINEYQTMSQQSPDLVYTNVDYRSIMGLFVQDYIQTPGRGNSNDKSFLRVVDDFNTGISYELDLTSGVCEVLTISTMRKDAYPLGNGLVRMRSSDEYFDIDSTQYQYMGVHRVRDIDCDTWSTKMTDNKPDHTQNALYTIYFATADWQKKTGFRTIQIIPVMIQVMQGNTLQQMYIYEFSTDPSKWLPDLTTCYNPNNTMNVEVFLKEEYILVQPADNNEIVVRFKLLEQLNVAGDVGTKPDKVPSKTIIANFVQQVNAGQFFVDLDQDGRVTLYARKGSVAVTKNTGRFQFIAPKTNNSTGYSPGAMAGIGIGMLVFGLVVGVVIIFLVKKFKKSGDDTIAMSTSK
uniref:LolA-like domain-containing protein n=1 Tax=Biomphalaria glabrata TaxID=6526 RepID=A0A2C9KTJ4_BIOGL